MMTNELVRHYSEPDEVKTPALTAMYDIIEVASCLFHHPAHTEMAPEMRTRMIPTLSDSGLYPGAYIYKIVVSDPYARYILEVPTANQVSATSRFRSVPYMLGISVVDRFMPEDVDLFRFVGTPNIEGGGVTMEVDATLYGFQPPVNSSVVIDELVGLSEKLIEIQKKYTETL